MCTHTTFTRIPNERLRLRRPVCMYICIYMYYMFIYVYIFYMRGFAFVGLLALLLICLLWPSLHDAVLHDDIMYYAMIRCTIL